MSDIPHHLIERAWDVYQTHCAGNGVEPEKLHFLSGAAALFGVLTGAIDVGIPEGTKTYDVMVQLQDEFTQYRAEIARYEEEARKRTERRNS